MIFQMEVRHIENHLLLAWSFDHPYAFPSVWIIFRIIWRLNNARYLNEMTTTTFPGVEEEIRGSKSFAGYRRIGTENQSQFVALRHYYRRFGIATEAMKLKNNIVIDNSKSSDCHMKIQTYVPISSLLVM